MFCNPGPIAAAWFSISRFSFNNNNFVSFLGKEVVKSAHESLVRAIIDLTDLGK